MPPVPSLARCVPKRQRVTNRYAMLCTTLPRGQLASHDLLISSPFTLRLWQIRRPVAELAVDDLVLDALKHEHLHHVLY